MGTEIEVVFNVGANALIDQCAELRVVEGCAVLFDQAMEFVENEVFRVDAVVERPQERLLLSRRPPSGRWAFWDEAWLRSGSLEPDFRPDRVDAVYL